MHSDEHNKLELVWRQTEYIGHIHDITDRTIPESDLMRSWNHHIERNNELVCLYPYN